MVAVPSPWAYTVPSLTVATAALEVDHVTPVGASAGCTTALSWSVSPGIITRVPLALKTTFLGLGGAMTFTFTEALLPLSVRTEMIAVPFFTGTTRPLASTVATPGLEESQVRFALA